MNYFSKSKLAIVKRKYFSVDTLFQRGWNSKDIAHFLKTHDSVLEKPYNGSSKIKLYLADRVIAVEKSDEFRNLKDDIRKKEMMKEIDRITSNIKKTQNFKQIMTLAIDSYNRFRSFMFEVADQTNLDPSTPTACADSDEKFLKRITVNYIRHNLSDFNEIENHGREIYKELNKKVYLRIAELYPELEEECKRQMKAKGIKWE